MGPTEEAGKVALGTIDALKSQPLALALLVVNLLYLFVGLWIWHKSTEFRTAFVNDVVKSCITGGSAFGPSQKDQP